MPATQRVVILDTGCANLSSVRYALERLGYQPLITDDKQQIINCDKLILPGVGTAQAAMHNLTAQQLVEVIQSCTQPVLGICLGMQLLAAYSEEGHLKTLGIIPQHVVKMSAGQLPLPHMGWNTVMAEPSQPLFRGLAPHSYFYFVHSYAMAVGPHTLATTDYGSTFSSAIQQDNFYGVQFHPERSGHNGMQLLKNFLEM